MEEEEEEEEEEEGCHGGRLPPRKGGGGGLVGEIGGVLWCEQTQVWWVVELRLIGPIQALIQTIGIQNRSGHSSFSPKGAGVQVSSSKLCLSAL